MDGQHATAFDDVVRSSRAVEPRVMSCPQLIWLIGETLTPGAEQTFGVVTILPGKRNPLHRHPNCEELLYVLEGEAEHMLGDQTFNISAGDVIRIPRGTPHWARATGEKPLVAVISFSAADRQTENLEETNDIA